MYLCFSENYFYYQYCKHYWNQTGILQWELILTLVTVSLLPTNHGHQDSAHLWHLHSIIHIYKSLKLQFMYFIVLYCLLLCTSETDSHIHSTHISPYSDVLKWTFTHITVHFFSPSTHTHTRTYVLALILCMYIKTVYACSRNDNGLIQVSLIPQAFTYLNIWWHYKGLHHMLFSGGPQHMNTKGNWATSSSSRYPNRWRQL